MACEVDTTGRVIVDTTTKERAELKRDQIHAYGPDWPAGEAGTYGAGAGSSPPRQRPYSPRRC